MEGFLGVEAVNINGTAYADYKPKHLAIKLIEDYGSIDGSHHKDWVIDQVVRILMGTKVYFSMASWSNGHTELRCSLGAPSKKYLKWRKNMGANYDEGIAP